MIRLLAIAFVMFLLSGCATLFKGSKETIHANSTPQGAEVFIDGVSYGLTPISFKLKTHRDYTVVFRYEGEERSVVIENNVGTLWIVLDVLGGLVPLIVDAATGDWHELSPNELVVSFN